MKSLYNVILLILILCGCTTWKGVLITQGNQDDAIKNAIYDFSYSYKKKVDSVFYVYTEDIDQEVLGINIFGTYDKVLVSTEDSVTFSYHGFPSGYFENEGMLFYWHDSTKSVTDDLISVFEKYNLIDTTIVNVYIPESTIDHSKKGVDYYFCKKNLLIYKKVKTNLGLGSYDPPELNCN